MTGYALFTGAFVLMVNAFVGAMIGMERSILPAIAEEEFQLAAKTAILSFIVVFGITKALTNYFAGRWSDRFGRKAVLVAGWLFERQANVVGDSEFHAAKRAAADYFNSVVVPEARGLAAGAEAGAAMLYAVSAGALA